MQFQIFIYIHPFKSKKVETEILLCQKSPDLNEIQTQYLHIPMNPMNPHIKFELTCGTIAEILNRKIMMLE